MKEKEESLKQVGKIVAGAYYDMQQIRIATIGRIRDVVRKKLEGIKVDEVEDKKKEKNLEKKYRDSELQGLLKEAEKKGKLTQKEYNYIEKCLQVAIGSAKIENKYKKAMLEYIQVEPVYTVFLKKIRGIGEVLSANLIKEFGYCEKYDNVAKLWSHTGNGVTAGIAPRKRKGEDLTFSPRLRTMTWKISDCLMKSNHGIYRQIYDSEKKKQLAREYKEGELFEKYSKPYKKEETKLRLAHSHNRALRKMRKLFLSHYWACARELMELPCKPLYVEEKLGHKDIITWRNAISKEK